MLPKDSLRYAMLRFVATLSFIFCLPFTSIAADGAYIAIQANQINASASERPGLAPYQVSFDTAHTLNAALLVGYKWSLEPQWQLSAELLWQPNGHSYTTDIRHAQLGNALVGQVRGDISAARALSLHLGYVLANQDQIYAKLMRGSYDWKVNTRVLFPQASQTQTLGSDFYTALGAGYQMKLNSNWWLRPEALAFVDTEANKNPYFKFTTYELALSLGYNF